MFAFLDAMQEAERIASALPYGKVHTLWEEKFTHVASSDPAKVLEFNRGLNIKEDLKACISMVGPSRPVTASAVRRFFRALAG